MSKRFVFLAALFFCATTIPVLGGSASVLPRGPAVKLADGTAAPGFVQGIPWRGEQGITESVAEIMAREAEAIPFKLRETKRPFTLRKEKQSNRDAPGVARWPVPNETTAQPSALQGLNPQTVGTSFLGMQFSESGFFPPDPVGDAGPTQILAATNGRIRVFDKSGALGGLNVTLDNFFTLVGGVANGAEDPHIRYDRLSGRWFVTAISANNTPNDVLIAVSSGSTITNATSFTFFQFQQDLVGPMPNVDSGGFADYPTLGVDKFALYVGVNVFNLSPITLLGTTGFVINKDSLLAGMLMVTAFRGLTDLSCATDGFWSPQGVYNDDPQATEGYFIGVDFCFFGRLGLRRVSNPGGVPSILGDIPLNVPPTTFPINQVQPAPGPTLDALDDRLFAAAIHKNKITGAKTLWTAHNIEVNSSGVGDTLGGRNGSRWYEIGNLTTSPTLVQAGTLFDPAASTPFGFWFPSVAISGQGHMALGCSRASANAVTGFAGVAAAGRLRTDGLGTTQAATLAQSSSNTYNLSAVPQRWGDFSQTVVDPNDDQTMWTFQEYCNTLNSWGVRVIQLRAPPPATPTSAVPSTMDSGQGSVNVTISGTSISGSEFFDPGLDAGGPGFLNHIGALVTGSVMVNSVAFNSPTSVTLNISTVGAALGGHNVTITNPDGQSRTGINLLTITPTDVKEIEGRRPFAFELSQNYPNPFNPGTTIRFALPRSGRVQLEVFNLLGQKIKTLVDEKLSAGVKEVSWDGRDETGRSVPSGTYFYRLFAGDYTKTRKMILLK